MRRVVMTLTLLCGFGMLAPLARAQIVSPAPGVDMPPSVRESLQDRSRFQFTHAWVEKARKAREERERYIDERGFYRKDMIQLAERPRYSVSGTFYVPVFCSKYSNTGADPFPIASLQTKLFDGPFAPRTLTQFYSEISYGDLNVTGTVYGWTTLPNTASYYAGPGTCDGLCPSAHIYEYLISTLTANDAAVNFGQFDNDGPDGIPNSGDDDGYVDFAAFVQPEAGAECGFHGNIWSHRYALTYLGGAFVTNDAKFGGGFIRVDDYVIQPIYNCDATTLIDIGVFCHEFGHAFGLPDLYDDSGSQGIGHWGLMGSGNWNVPSSPAHMCAWSKNQLGWSNVVVVPATPTPFDIYNVENNREIYRMDVTHERWRRMTECAIDGFFSMRCGMTGAEAANRNWAGGSGYGNNWETTVSRDFNYSGVGSVSLQYQYGYELEPTYDFVYGEVTSGGNTSTFVTYNGVGNGNANIDLTPYLSAGPYKVAFRMTSDVAWSDEDGSYPTTCGAMRIDNVSVSGGGETYFTDFETREDGWAEEMNPPSEYFLVENRQPLGSDVAIWGGGGLVIWHIDTADQTGGPSNNRPRGVAVEQADGLNNLENNLNRGDGGDPYPGSTNNLAFNGATNPNSNGHDGPSTVTVALNTGNADPMNATMKGGWPAPAPVAINANTGTSGNIETVEITGSLFAKTPTVDLVLNALTIPATSVYWSGKDRLMADFDLTGAPNGFYDVVVVNPGGASASLTDAYEVSGAPTAAGDTPRKFALLPAYPNPFNPSTTIRYEIPARANVELKIYDVSGALVRTLVNEDKAAGAYALQWNGLDDRNSPVSSGIYFYRITAGDYSDVRKMTLVK